MVSRTLRSAFLASSLLAADIVILVLYLNPEARLARDGAGLLESLFVPYTLAGGAAFFAIAFAAGLSGWSPVGRPPFPRLPWVTTLAVAALSLASGLLWLNLLCYRHSIPTEFVRGLAASSVAVSGAVLVLASVVVDALLFPRRGRWLSGPLVVLASASAVVVPLALRPPLGSVVRPVPVATDRVQPTRRIVLVGIDGLGPSMVEEGVARGTLPILARLMKRGSSGPLATLRPTEGPPIWTTIFTGGLPRDHGIKSFETYRLRGSPTSFELLPKGALVSVLERLNLVATEPVSASSRKRRALWTALNAFGIRTGIVRFWGTHPPEKVQGFMLSSAFHVLLATDPSRAGDALFPSDLLPEARTRAVAPADVDPGLVAQFVDLSVDVRDDPVPWRHDLVDRALAPDLTYQRVGGLLRDTYDPPFFATYFNGLDVVGHSFMRYSSPEAFGNVPPREARRYGHVVDRYLALLSQWIGDFERALRPGDILLVVSGHGMEPAPLWRRTLGWVWGDPALGGTHEGAPDGFIIALGDGVRSGVAVKGASVLDVAPTILYLMGLPVARDMEGRVLTEILDDDFARAHPVTFVPSYESLAVTPVVGSVATRAVPMTEETP
jgi:predicted AlkP superfamily phosphohydrolase/phosphomutase